MTKEELIKLSEEHPIIVFDGVCNLCNRFIQFLFAADTDQVLRYATLQSESGKEIKTDDIDSVYLIDKGEIYYFSDAVVQVAKYLPLWNWVSWMSVIPSVFRNAIYKMTAKNRYRIFGKKSACMVPTPDQRKQFLDF